MHVAAEEASVPAESSNASKFLIFAILSAVRVYMQCLSAFSVSLRISAGIRIRAKLKERARCCAVTVVQCDAV